MVMEVGDKVIFVNGRELSFGYIDGKYDNFYHVDRYNGFLTDNQVKPYDFGDEIKKVYGSAIKKRYTYCFLIVEKDCLKIRFCGIYGKNNSIFIQRLCEKFGSIRERNIFVLSCGGTWINGKWSWENRFGELRYGMLNNFVSPIRKNWVKFETINEEVEYKITCKDDIQKINKIVGKDFGYLIGLLYGELKEVYKNFLNKEYLLSFIKENKLDVYVKVKKDLCSDGEELLN